MVVRRMYRNGPPKLVAHWLQGVPFCHAAIHTTKLSTCTLAHSHPLHNCTSTRHSALLTPQPSAYKTSHICHVCYAHYELSCNHPQYNSLSMHVNLHYTPSTTHSTAFHNPPMHTTNTRHNWQNSTRCRDDVKVLWCHSHLVWLVFEGSIPTCACFHSENFFCDLYKLDPGIRTDQQLGLNIRITISVCVLLCKPVHSYTLSLTFLFFPVVLA